MARPLRVFPAALQVEAGHAELREREGQKDVDGVHDHQRGDASLGVDQEQDRAHPHEDDAVSHGKAHRQGRETVRQPGIDSHVGHHPRAVHEPGLRRDQQQSPLGEDGNEGDGPAQRPVSEKRVRQDRIQRLPLNRLDPYQRIAEKEQPGGEGQGSRHVHHGPLPGLHPRLAHDLQTVGHRLDPRIGAASQGVGAQEDHHDTEDPDGGEVVRESRVEVIG